VPKTRFKHVIRRICQGKCVLNLNYTDVSPENFLTLFLCRQTIFGKKMKFEQGIKKKLLTHAINFEKIIVQVGNRSPKTFLMVRPLA
jgi:hypothetical protein